MIAEVSRTAVVIKGQTSWGIPFKLAFLLCRERLCADMLIAAGSFRFLLY